MSREEHRYRGIRYDYLIGPRTYVSMLDREEEYVTSNLTAMFEAIDDMLAYYAWEHGERESS